LTRLLVSTNLDLLVSIGQHIVQQALSYSCVPRLDELVNRYELFALSFLAIISSVTLSDLDDMIRTLESYITAYDSNGDRFIVEEKSAVSSNYL